MSEKVGAPALEVALSTVSVDAVDEEVKAFLYTNLYEPWNVAPDFDWLAAGDGGRFLIARDVGGTLVGTARIMPTDKGTAGHPLPPECSGERRLRQILIAPQLRRRGLGAWLMGEAEAYAHESGARRTGLAARESAYGFYQRCGYSRIGEEYLSPLTGIPHTHMSKALYR
jgi:predicted GNAT family N-acyltransferase